MNFQVAFLSDVGCIRSNNEDSFWLDAERGLFVLADGMGGHNAGEIASSLACQVISEALSKDEVAPRQTCTALDRSIQEAHRVIRSQGQANPALKDMGTTVEVLWLRARSAYWAHVGDSRIYLFREGILKQLTEDHSLVNEYVRDGTLTPQQARGSALRNIVLQALGTSEAISVQTGHLGCRQGDLFLLCSDGLTDVLNDEELASILSSTAELEDAARRLVQQAKDLGGPDNITVILARAIEHAQRAQLETP